VNIAVCFAAGVVVVAVAVVVVVVVCCCSHVIAITYQIGRALLIAWGPAAFVGAAALHKYRPLSANSGELFQSCYCHC
jgi:hypothetical protein